MSTRPPSQFAPYKSALEAVSARTKTPLPSLIASFAVLHELTAIIPLISVFFLARSLGFGEQAIAFVRNEVVEDEDNRGWIRDKGAQWIDEGEQWAARLGKRYGVFGYSKMPKGSDTSGSTSEISVGSKNLAGDVTNAVFAYGVTKALLPARIGLSMYLAPAFSRRVVEPFRSRIMGSWSRQPPP